MASSNFWVMRTLLKKDWRLARIQVWGLLLVGFGCYAISLALLYDRPWEDRDLTEAISAASSSAMLFSTLIAAALGGAAIAGERTAGSADFLAMLPVSRRQIVASKWLVSFDAIVLCIMFHAIVGGLATGYGRRFSSIQFIRPSDVNGILACAAFTLSLFAVSWLFSTCSTSSVISACAAIGITGGSIVWFAIWLHERPEYHSQNDPLYIAVLAGSMSVASLVGGTWYYLRRTNP
jgi:ABC-type transport system involved in multi-copper enzyme maturation permease subunit